MKAIRIHEAGGPENMRYEDVPEPTPQKGQAVVKLDAIGVNFVDIYRRSGIYPMTLPAILGEEGAGTVTAIAPDVKRVKVGDRVAWTSIQGAYAEFAALPADRLLKLPASVTSKQGAAIMLQGMTAHYLACTIYPLKPGDTCLVHAGAGGVGLLLTHVAKIRGARVITTVSTEEKAALSRGAGADLVLNYVTQDFESKVKAYTDGKGVQVVFDAVGKATYEKSMNCTAPRGMIVFYGQTSGLVPPIDPLALNRRGSLFLTRPTLAHYIATRAELEERANDLFRWIAEGKIRVKMDTEFPLWDAIRAHQALAGRMTMGKILLIP